MVIGKEILRRSNEKTIGWRKKIDNSQEVILNIVEALSRKRLANRK